MSGAVVATLGRRGYVLGKSHPDTTHIYYHPTESECHRDSFLIGALVEVPAN